MRGSRAQDGQGEWPEQIALGTKDVDLEGLVMSDISVGDRVTWSWGAGTAEGKVTERFTSKVSREIKGSKINRNATQDEPAFLIQQDDGDQVLKSITELDKA